MYNYTTVNRIISSIKRDTGEDISRTDIIEWAGQAMEHLLVYATKIEKVTFLEVNNYQAALPQYMVGIIQVARDNFWIKNEDQENVCSCLEKTAEEDEPEEIKPCGCTPCLLDCHGNIIGQLKTSYYRPFIDIDWRYSEWVGSNYYRNQNRFTPIRLSNHTFFNSIVCREKDQTPYINCIDEYTIAGDINKILRVSFKEGLVALSYLQMPIDVETGFPLIVDEPNHISAIGYYIKWKLSEKYQWNNQEGFKTTLPEKMRRDWLRYAKQARNNAKMPKSLDEQQNAMEQRLNLIPNSNQYYTFYGNLGRRQPNTLDYLNDPRRLY